MIEKTIAALVSFFALLAIYAGVHLPTTDIGQSYALHSNVTSTVFWVGEAADSDNGYIANRASAWDDQWQKHYGGIDDPLHRVGYRPQGFTPLENAFYVALPYNDIDENGTIKPARPCKEFSPQPFSALQCKNSWVEIRLRDKVVYAQWEDVGPFGENDTAYVFGNATPTNKNNSHAGIDVSPAVRDYMHLKDIDTVSWRFVNTSQVPVGPWKTVITTSVF